ncbi:MAG: nitrilase family protein, partial [Muribaculaceae bacterium]|nr:nitrilase family protein [Muribaculaceae bacterium]
MNDSVNIAVIPLDIALADKNKNLDAVTTIVRSLRSDVDVVVLPELFSTGFISDAALTSELAESNSGNTIATLTRLAAECNLAICGSFLACTAGSHYNRGFFIEPSGETTWYDKHHLFSLSCETKLLDRGEVVPPLVRFRGWTFSFIVCYDLRFPAWCRNVNQRYDIMLVPANWPVSRRYAWEHLLIGRAIENQAYYIGADRGGTDDYGCYDDMTMAFDYMGMPVGHCDPD